MADNTDELNNINTILETVGTPKKYQLFIFFWIFVALTMTTTFDIVMPFNQADMDFRCNQTDFILPTVNFSSMSDNDIPSCFANDTVPQCTQFDYDQKTFVSTTVSQFDLVCSRATLLTLSNMLYMAAGIPGGVICGAISDRWGRRKPTIIYMFWVGAFGLATAYSTNIAMYIVLRCLTAPATAALYDSTSALLSEITSPERRPHILIGVCFTWSTSIWVLTLLSYYIRDWSYLYIAISAPCILFGILSIWILDESPHWLVSQQRYDEAQRVIDKMIRWNKIQDNEDHRIQRPDSEPTDGKISDRDNDNISEPNSDGDESVKEGCCDIFKSSLYLRIIAICSFGWLASNLGYVGLYLGVDELGDDLFLNSFIGGAVETVAYALCFVTMKTGRKWLYIALQIIGGLSLIISGFVISYAAGITWLIVTLTMIGRLCISASWQVLYVWCVELFPTTVRVIMVQTTMFAGKIGNTIGPLIRDLKKIIKDDSIREEMIAPCLYGALLVVAGVLALSMPETNNRPLPVTIKEAVKTHGGQSNTRKEEGNYNISDDTKL